VPSCTAETGPRQRPRGRAPAALQPPTSSPQANRGQVEGSACRSTLRRTVWHTAVGIGGRHGGFRSGDPRVARPRDGGRILHRESEHRPRAPPRSDPTGQAVALGEERLHPAAPALRAGSRFGPRHDALPDGPAGLFTALVIRLRTQRPARCSTPSRRTGCCSAARRWLCSWRSPNAGAIWSRAWTRATARAWPATPSPTSTR
jgi:hypothetical protein